ncbi:uncharacterized protein LOC129722255 [Wyeomyia smithii]|uniref:uncharacterized protein LOC129722255 n=1 Tax=Wyeomyia smithii TaxID=174621 RepID=UPI002467E4CE|nr:uncharacterized protein LOC129722255 [Wyeomyia smithii]
MGTILEAILKATKYYYDTSLDEPKAKEIVERINFTVRDRNEAAMLIAFLIVESDGFTWTENDSVESFFSPYHGRGYIKLRCGSNYNDASRDLYEDDRLLKTPDFVATGATFPAVTSCLDASLWVWKKRVQPLLARLPLVTFYMVMKALIGEGDKDSVSLKERYDVYVIAAKHLGLTVGLTPMQ